MLQIEAETESLDVSRETSRKYSAATSFRLLSPSKEYHLPMELIKAQCHKELSKLLVE